MKKMLWNAAAVLILVLLLAGVGGYLTDRYSAIGDYQPYFIWMHIWALLAGLYLGRDRVRHWMDDGMMRVDKTYMVVPLLYLICYIPGLPLYQLLAGSNVMPLFAVLAAYNLVCSIHRDGTKLPTERRRTPLE